MHFANNLSGAERHTLSQSFNGNRSMAACFCVLSSAMLQALLSILSLRERPSEKSQVGSNLVNVMTTQAVLVCQSID